MDVFVQITAFQEECNQLREQLSLVSQENTVLTRLKHDQEVQPWSFFVKLSYYHYD